MLCTLDISWLRGGDIIAHGRQ